MNTAVLEARSLAIGYAGRKGHTIEVAANLTAALRSGELVCLLGPNGAGKSTLLRTLTGIREPLDGAVFFEGKHLKEYTARELAQRSSVVLTHRVAVGSMPVSTLVSLGRYPFTDWAGRIGQADRDAVARSLAAVGIESLAHRPFIELSDGEQQKAMIARALAQEPRVMILDEPTAFLDLPRRVELVHLLRRLAREDGRAVLMSTHELDLAMRTADRLWLLPPGGPLVEGTPEDLVLRGSISSVFASGSVRFDSGSGSFEAHASERGVVGITGSGEAFEWTVRALARMQYRVSPDALQFPLVEVDGSKEETHWRLRKAGGTVEVRSIAELLAALDNKDNQVS